MSNFRSAFLSFSLRVLFFHINEKCPARNRARHLFFGADEANRTPDLLITNQLLYQLSYISEAEYSTNKSGTAVSAKAVSPGFH